VTGTPSRYGSGGRPPTPYLPTWTGAGRRSCAASTWNTFRLFKQLLGWTTLKIRDPAAADRWTWLIITTHAQLRLARPLADDLRLPWERPAPPGRLTPARVRRGFRNIRATLPCPVRCTKNRQTRPRPPTWLEEPSSRTRSRGGEDNEKGPHTQGTARTRRLRTS
jgi:hypothetical protein